MDAKVAQEIPARWSAIKASDAIRLHMALGNYVRLWPYDDESRDEYFELCRELGLSQADAKILAFDVVDNYGAFRAKELGEGAVA